MWTRRELKQQAKDALQRNYWKSVLVALAMMMLGGNWVGNVFSSASGVSDEVNMSIMEETSEAEEDVRMDVDDSEYFAEILSEDKDSLRDRIDDKITDDMDGTATMVGYFIGIIMMVVIFLVVFLIMITIVLVYEILLVFPLMVGAGRFMIRSLEGRAEVKDVAYAFDHSYKNIVKTMFHTQLSIFLWALLFLIPGIYKQYQYRMVEYILAEHPNMPYRDVMQRSKDMMSGQKWKAFVLDLSFILWKIVSVLTCGLAHIFYIAPYQYLTNAALYRKLSAMQENRITVEMS